MSRNEWDLSREKILDIFDRFEGDPIPAIPVQCYETKLQLKNFGHELWIYSRMTDEYEAVMNTMEGAWPEEEVAQALEGLMKTLTPFNIEINSPE